MPEKEARPPAQNRRSGAPRGAHTRSQGCAKAPRKRLSVPRKHAMGASHAPSAVSALRSPSFGEQSEPTPRAQTRRGNAQARLLFEIVNVDAWEQSFRPALVNRPDTCLPCDADRRARPGLTRVNATGRRSVSR
jgi:hypothetical protein